MISESVRAHSSLRRQQDRARKRTRPNTVAGSALEMVGRLILGSIDGMLRVAAREFSNIPQLSEYLWGAKDLTAAARLDRTTES